MQTEFVVAWLRKRKSGYQWTFGYNLPEPFLYDMMMVDVADFHARR